MASMPINEVEDVSDIASPAAEASVTLCVGVDGSRHRRRLRSAFEFIMRPTRAHSWARILQFSAGRNAAWGETHASFADGGLKKTGNGSLIRVLGRPAGLAKCR